ncbi:patatin-like phospholipase family protein [Pseudogracilibacillus auburnensis]|uniref:patatin-like phospholipase family protein n=1 Tax=Pseudogracilibacillus auburnensis TaxID=1494959 RepID=UPI001A96B307|nr:patatin-like phospholipase family protein [Pseudogracilibacillus auburnensis]MBO1004283.1 patatin-like phospholipase family protein [Pseudogracilibacillus auburnensis]
MKIDCVFSGGGVKAFSFIGALQSIYDKKISIERVAGTSAGAIIASLIAADYKVEEINQLFQHINLKKFLDPPFLSEKIPFSKWIFLYFQMGLYKGNLFEKWLESTLLTKGIDTFADLEEGYLKVVVSDISLGKLIVIPDDLQRVYGIDGGSFKVSTAVRMSASFPYFFMPKILQNKEETKSYIVDGGLLSNFPFWVFRERETDVRPVLGLTLSDSIEQNQPQHIKNALDMLHAIFQAMLRAHDTRYISTSMKNNIIFIPVKDVKTTDLMISEEEKHSLIQLGREKTDQFLQFWPT